MNFKTFSMTGTGLIGLFVTYALGQFGYEASAQSVEGLVVAILAIVSSVLSFWGQVRRKDLIGGIVRK